MDIIEFILKAKVSGYARHAEEQKVKFDDGSIGFKYETDQLSYLDRYYGTNPFAGSEYIYNSDGTLVWLMNYYGGVTNQHESMEQIYSFLREVMLLITPDYPFRGPERLEGNSFLYENRQIGTIDRFNGTENILYGSDLVYSLHYHGGSLREIT